MPKKNVIKKSALAPTALIAGGAGFIGSYLAEALLEKDVRVIVLDNFNTGKKNYVEHLLNNPKFAVYDVDINQGFPEEVQSADYILHFAGLETYLSDRQNITLDSLLTNAIGTKNLLDLANKSGAKFLLASSINVYQAQISSMDLANYFGHTKEEEKKYELIEAKRFAEALVWEYYKRHDNDVRIVRLPEVYGPKMDLEACGPLGIFFQDLIQDKDQLSIHGEGIEKEYYLYISDAVAGIIKTLFNKNTKGKIYTLVEKEPYTTLETAFLLRSVANKEIQIKYEKKTSATKRDPKIPDNSNIAGLRWQPKVTFKDGVIKTLESFGYTTNTHAFKPNKIITDKLKAKETEVLSSLQGIAQPKEVPKKGFPITEKLKALFKKKPPTPPSQEKPEDETPAVTYQEPAVTKPKAKIGPLSTSVLALLTTTSLLSFLTIFIVLPAAQTYFYSKKAVGNLEKIPTTLAQLQTEEAKKNANDAFQDFSKAQHSLGRLNWIFNLLGKKQQFNSSYQLLSSTTYFSKAMYNTSDALQPLNSIWEVVKPNSEESFSADQFSRSKVNLDNAKVSLQLAQAEFKNVKIEHLPKSLQNKATTYEKALSQAVQGVDMALLVATDIPDLVGIESPRKYLILFQNSNEIRPTGGFIGSYATLELDKGKITSLVIDDIYNPDGQIDIRNIVVEPPQPIAELLEEDRLYIRNANWNLSFPQSAKTIEDLLFKVNGDHYDGIIAIDLYVAKGLLEIAGPVFLTAYNEEITSKNIYERTQYHSEFNFKNGNDQKRSFLTILGSKLLEKTFALPKEKMPELLNEIHTLLNQKHALIYIPNNPIGMVLNNKSWDGDLVKTEGDYLYVVNANLGGTKANYFVENDMSYRVSSDTRDGVLRATLTLNYKHTGQDSSWPGGPYTNYVRVLTQMGAKLTGASRVLDGGEKEDIFKEIIIAREGKYNSFETSFTIQPQENIEVILTYDLATNLSLTKDKKTYELYWQKQPGTQNDMTTFEFKAPFGTEFQSAYPEMVVQGNNTQLQGPLNTDQNFLIELK